MHEDQEDNGMDVVLYDIDEMFWGKNNIIYLSSVSYVPSDKCILMSDCVLSYPLVQRRDRGVSRGIATFKDSWENQVRDIIPKKQS